MPEYPLQPRSKTQSTVGSAYGRSAVCEGSEELGHSDALHTSTHERRQKGGEGEWDKIRSVLLTVPLSPSQTRRRPTKLKLRFCLEKSNTWADILIDIFFPLSLLTLQVT